MQDRIEETQVTLLEWIEPEIRQLDVHETAFRNGPGADGNGNQYPDCARS